MYDPSLVQDVMNFNRISYDTIGAFDTNGMSSNLQRGFGFRATMAQPQANNDTLPVRFESIVQYEKPYKGAVMDDHIWL